MHNKMVSKGLYTIFSFVQIYAFYLHIYQLVIIITLLIDHRLKKLAAGTNGVDFPPHLTKIQTPLLPRHWQKNF
jgi:hypothetical protein